MRDLWQHDLESLEAINQDDDTRELILRMAALARGGRLDTFIDVVDSDTELDQLTKSWVLELADNEPFLLAAEDYLSRCRQLH